MIVSIPLPLLWRVKMPAIRKMVCGLWLCSGIFVMIATILRCALVLQNKDNINISTIWSIRETVRAPAPIVAYLLSSVVPGNYRCQRPRARTLDRQECLRHPIQRFQGSLQDRWDFFERRDCYYRPIEAKPPHEPTQP